VCISKLEICKNQYLFNKIEGCDMEEKEAVITEGANGYEPRSLKPFLGAFIVLIILLSGYYFVWRSITIKMKGVLEEYLKNYKYDSISIGGFPFTKKVKVNNITFGNRTFLTTKNQVNIKRMVISSFIFSDTFNVKLDDVTTISSLDSAVYSLVYNEDPEINISFYSNGRLKAFNYSDIGYRVVNDQNKTLYTADKSNLRVQSTLNDDTVDYSINGDLQNMQNIMVLEKDADISAKEVPEAYNLEFDISTSITKVDGEVKNSIIKVNDINLVGNRNNKVSVTGEIFREPGDPYSFGNLTVALSNYKTLLKDYKDDVLEALKVESSELPSSDKSIYVSIVNAMFDEINSIIKKNSATTDEEAFILISRVKNSPDYIVNGESLFAIIQRIME